LCNVCARAGTREEASEVAQIPSNVREFRDERFTLWRCRWCRSLHCQEDVDLDYYYARYPLQHHRLGYVTRRAYGNRLRLLRWAGVKREHQLLDFGCGQGLFVSLLRGWGYEGTRGYDPYVREFAQPAALEATYDAVFSFGVIEHVPEPREFLETHRRLVRSGGLALIATPNADTLDLARPDALLLHQPYHRHILSRQSLVEMASAAGFRLKKISHRNWLDTPHPAVNGRFVADYIAATGGVIDSLFEPPRPFVAIRSPRLWSSLWLGYFFPQRGYMVCTFERQ
jgi:2-polyprenyl-3-methyl-5-hydroxy-6-metoxy-1,4-benzoquinol methylase